MRQKSTRLDKVSFLVRGNNSPFEKDTLLYLYPDGTTMEFRCRGYNGKIYQGYYQRGLWINTLPLSTYLPEQNGVPNDKNKLEVEIVKVNIPAGCSVCNRKIGICHEVCYHNNCPYRVTC